MPDNDDKSKLSTRSKHVPVESAADSLKHALNRMIGLGLRLPPQKATQPAERDKLARQMEGR